MWTKLWLVSEPKSPWKASTSCQYQTQRQTVARHCFLKGSKRIVETDKDLPESSPGTGSYTLFNDINANQWVLEIGSLFPGLSSCKLENFPCFPKGLYLVGLVKTSNPRSSTVQDIQGPLTCSIYQLIRWNNGIHKAQSISFLPFDWLWHLFKHTPTGVERLLKFKQLAHKSIEPTKRKCWSKHTSNISSAFERPTRRGSRCVPEQYQDHVTRHE